ncbi:MAG TPA: hypothetical protein VF407_02140, partial [Polyangiaceae bacterium]
MKQARFAAAALCAALTLAPVHVASAQSSDAGIASQLFDAGRDLMKKGDYANACPKLAQSAKLEPRVGTYGRLAECEEKIGHLAAARGHWQDAVDLAQAQKDDRAAHASDELKRVDALVPRLVITMTSPPSDVDVKLDDVSIGAASLGVPLPIDPGTHNVAVSASGKTPWKATVEAKADGSTMPLTVPALLDASASTVVAPPPPVAAPPPKENVEPPPAKEETSRPLRTVGIVTAIVGGVVVVAGAGLGLVANSKANSSYDEGCA